MGDVIAGRPQAARARSAGGGMTCDLCTADAAVVLPGDEEQRCDLFLTNRGTPMRRFCLEHAVAGGCFIYPSERQPARRKAAV
jgi:hypothetical protein